MKYFLSVNCRVLVVFSLYASNLLNNVFQEKKMYIKLNLLRILF